MENKNFVFDDLCRFVGQTVTIFTTSGGLSGAGFTGVLIAIDCDTVKLLNQVGAAPACPIGSNCCNVGGVGRWGGLGGWANNNNCGNPLGAVTIIPVRNIACFTHNAI